MKQFKNSNIIEALIRQAGFVVMNKPSAEYLAAITVMYRYNPDGSVRWLMPEGGGHSHVLSFGHAASAKTSWVCKIFLELGLGGLVADGKMKLYADSSTVSYIRNKWHGVAG